MESRQVSELGGVLVVIGGFVAPTFIVQGADFGLIIGLLHVITISIAITGMGLFALMRPRLAPLAGLGAAGIAVDTFVFLWHAPLFAAPAIIGGLICIASFIPDAISGPKKPSAQ